jgi:cytochrome oxidase assembly protein ShyY1
MENAATDNTIWYVLAVLGLVYLIIIFRNKRGTKRRRSRKFMEGKRQHERDN